VRDKIRKNGLHPNHDSMLEQSHMLSGLHRSS
jgi:hypothetical protein